MILWFNSIPPIRYLVTLASDTIFGTLSSLIMTASLSSWYRFLSWLPLTFLQPKHLHNGVQASCAWNHSQYFFKQPDFLQAHPLECLGTVAPVGALICAPVKLCTTGIGCFGAAIFGRKALGLRSIVALIAAVLFILIINVVLSVYTVASTITEGTSLESLTVKFKTSGVIFSCKCVFLIALCSTDSPLTT